MATAKRKSAKSRSATGKSAHKTRTDAISLLMADHRQVEGWFAEFAHSRSANKKQQLAAQICSALRVHTSIEGEIFYPAFLSATRDKDIHHEAIVEHDGAKKLIVEIEKSDPGDDYFDAKVTVLSEMIKHHVKEEEQPKGMFAEAKASKMDLEELGRQLLQRKQELSGEMGGKPNP
ncbi:MAG: hemerythrin domain-containing protein [Steroidobacteraceae bacterium]